MAKPSSLQEVFDLVQCNHSLRVELNPKVPFLWHNKIILTRDIWVGTRSIVTGIFSPSQVSSFGLDSIKNITPFD